MQVTEADFDNVYKPVNNHLDSNASMDGAMFETFGEEINYVFQLSKTSNKVWTIVEGDDDELMAVAGFHYVNRLGFIVTERGYANDDDYVLFDIPPSE